MIAFVHYCTAHTAHQLAEQGWAVVHLSGRVWRAVLELPRPAMPRPPVAVRPVPLGV